jgi:ribosomal protein S18 acetylase RimI-like enzyme
VKKKYRKRSVGAALLSLGIGIVQKDFRMKKESSQFVVVASDITHLGMGCYQNFGFQIKEGIRVSSGYYNDLDHVPEINILEKKATYWGRLKKRMRIDVQ